MTIIANIVVNAADASSLISAFAALLDESIRPSVLPPAVPGLFKVSDAFGTVVVVDVPDTRGSLTKKTTKMALINPRTAHV